MQETLAVCSQKGGVGKTTLALNLGLALAELGVPVTVVEIDPQGCLVASLARSGDSGNGLMQFLENRAATELPLLSTKVPGFNLLPVGDLPPESELDFEDLISEGERLGEILNQTFERGSQIVLLDCPSGFGAIVQAALRHAGGVLVPIQAEPLALRGVGRFLRGIEAIQRESNPSLVLLGLVVMMLEKQSEASLAVLTSAWSAFDSEAICETVIPRRDEFLQASLLGIPVGFLGQHTHPEGRRFHTLAQEVLERLERGKEEGEDAGQYRTLV